ncbi:50S ribosomal protein L31 [Bacillus sp. SL00103]
MDVNSGYRFLSKSTKSSNETVEWEDGKTYPVIKVETSSDTHPFIQDAKIREKGGRAELFKKKYQM